MRELHDSPLHVTVRCAISRIGIVGPWERTKKQSRSICERYTSMVEDCFSVQNRRNERRGSVVSTGRRHGKKVNESLARKLPLTARLF